MAILGSRRASDRRGPYAVPVAGYGASRYKAVGPFDQISIMNFGVIDRFCPYQGTERETNGKNRTATVGAVGQRPDEPTRYIRRAGIVRNNTAESSYAYIWSREDLGLSLG